MANSVTTTASSLIPLLYQQYEEYARELDLNPISKLQRKINEVLVEAYVEDLAKLAAKEYAKYG